MSDDPKNSEIEFAAELLALTVPPACREGVEANLRLLAGHARVLEAWLKDREVSGK
jgi:hypothetical protein